MSIIYSLVCKEDNPRDLVPLCEYDNATGNYPQITLEMLRQLKGGTLRKTYMYNLE